jgi:hypothetical protein
MFSKNPNAEAESSIDIGIGEPLPQVCLACGAPATGVKTFVYEKPQTITESLVRVLGILMFSARNMVEENRRSYLVSLPVCEVHGRYDAALNDVALQPNRGHSVIVRPVCQDFILAVRAHRQALANAFSNQLTQSQTGDAREFLKSLEQQ